MIKIDLTRGLVTVESESGVRNYSLGSPEAFEIITKAWLRTGWDNKYVYAFSWLGRPIIQLPEDIIRVQEVLYRVRPDVVIETGVAHGGSLILYASLCKIMGHGRVIGVDIEIRPHNRRAIEAHELAPYITLIEGSSIDPVVVSEVGKSVRPEEQSFVMLDSNHTKAHVRKELDAYAEFVKSGSYIVAADGIMGDLTGAPRTQPDWLWNNPRAAAAEFVIDHPEFVLEEPSWPFNESNLSKNVTYWPGAWLKKK